MASEFVSIKELAVIFAVHEVTIRRAIAKGFIEAVRIGDGKRSPYRISRKSIDAIHQSILQWMASKARNGNIHENSAPKNTK